MHKRINRLIASIAAALAITSGAIVATQMATEEPASASFSWCTYTNTICFAQDSNGNGARFADDSLPLGVCFGMPAGWNDQLSSIKNTWPASVQINWYNNNPCGQRHTYAGGTTINQVWPNDAASAYCLGNVGGSVGCPV